MRKRLLPCDASDLPVTPESLQAAKEACWRDRYQVHMQTGVVITEDGKIILPTKGRDS